MNLAAHLVSFALLFCMSQASTQTRSSAKLIGSWQSANRQNVVTFRADGTGKNSNGSLFRWRLDKNALITRAVSSDGKAGQEFRSSIQFTRDGKEYALLFEGGKLRSIFYLLTKGGQRYANRTAKGRQYESIKSADQSSESPALEPSPASTKPRSSGGSKEGDSNLYHVGDNRQVSKAYATVNHSEVVLAADPVNPNRLLAASMFSPPPIDRTAAKVVVYSSEDGGKNWSLAFERKDKNPQSFADPAFAFRSDGTAYFVNMYWPDFGEEEGRRLQLVRRAAGSKSWEKASTIEGWHDRPFLAVDNTKGIYKDRLYCLAMNGLFVSMDNGVSFPIVTSFSPQSGYQYTGSGNPVVLTDGTLATLYNAYAEKKAGKAQPTGKQSGFLSVRISTDGGETLGDERILARYNFGQLSYSNVPAMTADTSSRDGKDQLFVVWNDAIPGGATGVFLSRSQDKGATWSAPLLLSEQLSFADKKEAGTYSAFLPSVSVNKDGVVAVAWYDTRGLSSDKAGWNFRFRASMDGGKTWLPSVRVSETTTAFPLKKRTQPALEQQRAAYHPGHTSGLCTDAHGFFHALWIDARTGIRQVWTASVAVRTPMDSGG